MSDADKVRATQIYAEQCGEDSLGDPVVVNAKISAIALDLVVGLTEAEVIDWFSASLCSNGSVKKPIYAVIENSNIITADMGYLTFGEGIEPIDVRLRREINNLRGSRTRR